MRKLYFMLFIFAFSMKGFGQEKVDSTKTLEDIIVKETFRISTDEEKFPIVLIQDFSEIIKIPDGIHWSLVAGKNKTRQNETWDSFHFNLSQPEVANIHPQPVKIFHAQFNDLSKWSLAIYKSDGSHYKTISGENDPPAAIPWDGRGENGELLNPGQNYTYNFIAIDKAGNKRTFPGETFSVPAYYSSTGDSLFVGIASAKLFSIDGFGLSQFASEYAAELAGLIKFYLKKGKIFYETSHPNKDDFINLLSENLKMDRNVFHYKQSYKKDRKSLHFWVE